MSQEPGSRITPEQAERTQALLAAIVASSDDAIISKDLDGVIDSWNQGAERLFGYTAAEAIGRRILIIIPPERQAEEQMILQRLRAGERVDHFDTVRIAKDGRLIDVSLTVSPISDRKGGIIGASKTARDITDRKRIEQARESMNKDLEREVAKRTQRAEQLRRLARELTSAEQRERQRLAQVLHDDLAQLLIVAKMRLRALSREPTGTVAAVEEHLDKAIRYTRGLISELSPRLLEDLGMLAALKWLAAEFDERYGLAVDATQVSGECTLTPEACMLLLTGVRELLVNIVKHAETNRAALSFSNDDQHVRVVVQDWGKGFDLNNPAAINRRDGGFGLVNLRERLELLDGSAAIDSRPGAGTRVTLELPVSAAETGADMAMRPRAHRRNASLDGPPKLPSQIAVLLVDDHQVVRDGLKRVLESCGDITIVGEAENGHDALRQAAALKPNVVLMDIAMPRQNGFIATRAITQTMPGTQVIVLTMHDGQESAASARAAGAFMLLAKGGSTQQIISAIRAAFDAQTAGGEMSRSSI